MKNLMLKIYARDSPVIAWLHVSLTLPPQNVSHSKLF